MNPEPFFKVSEVAEMVEIGPNTAGLSVIKVNGVECGKWYRGYGDGSSLVECLFPTPRKELRPCPTAEEAVMHVIKELSWFTRNIGVVGQRVYHGEPVFVAEHLNLPFGRFQKIQQGGRYWDFRAGVFHHNGSVEVKSRPGGLNWSACTHPMLVLARPQMDDEVIERGRYCD